MLLAPVNRRVPLAPPVLFSCVSCSQEVAKSRPHTLSRKRARSAARPCIDVVAAKTPVVLGHLAQLVVVPAQGLPIGVDHARHHPAVVVVERAAVGRRVAVRLRGLPAQQVIRTGGRVARIIGVSRHRSRRLFRPLTWTPHAVAKQSTITYGMYHVLSNVLLLHNFASSHTRLFPKPQALFGLFVR